MVSKLSKHLGLFSTPCAKPPFAVVRTWRQHIYFPWSCCQGNVSIMSQFAAGAMHSQSHTKTCCFLWKSSTRPSLPMDLSFPTKFVLTATATNSDEFFHRVCSMLGKMGLFEIVFRLENGIILHKESHNINHCFPRRAVSEFQVKLNSVGATLL